MQISGEILHSLKTRNQDNSLFLKLQVFCLLLIPEICMESMFIDSVKADTQEWPTVINTKELQLVKLLAGPQMWLCEDGGNLDLPSWVLSTAMACNVS